MVGFRKEAWISGNKKSAENSKRRAAERRQDYYKNPKKCEYTECSNFLSFEQACGKIRFCSRSCSNKGVNRITEITRKKISISLMNSKKKPDINKVCVICDNEFTVSYGKRKRQTCSFICSKKLSGKKAAITMKEKGTHAGWHNRKGEPSYPEKYFINLFKNEKLENYKREKKIGKWFIDFAFEEIKIAIEIDGRQHEDVQRKNSDILKDAYLREHGWKVIRIKWYNPQNDLGKQKLYPQIVNMKNLLLETLVATDVREKTDLSCPYRSDECLGIS